MRYVMLILVVFAVVGLFVGGWINTDMDYMIDCNESINNSGESRCGDGGDSYEYWYWLPVLMS